MSNKLTEMAREILSIEADLPYRLDYSNKSHPTVNDFELHTFEQTWGSTALGFGGIGGQAMTTARTYVFIPIGINQKCFVYLHFSIGNSNSLWKKYSFFLCFYVHLLLYFIT